MVPFLIFSRRGISVFVLKRIWISQICFGIAMNMENMRFVVLLVLAMAADTIVMAERPQLLSNQLFFAERKVTSSDYEFAQASFLFDQDLYVNEPFLCGKMDEDCKPVECKLCDWTKEENTGCFDPECCGPEESSVFTVQEQRGDWCDSTLHFTKLELNSTTDRLTLDIGETAYFRFFLAEEHLCLPIQVNVRTEYGNNVLAVSRFYAQPALGSSDFEKDTAEYSYGGAMLTICPQAHWYYGLGTYAVSVHASQPTSFTVELAISSQGKLTPPPDAISCSSVPPKEFTNLGSEEEGAVVMCLEDTKTQTVEFEESFAGSHAQLIMPLPAGCHEISLAATVVDSREETDGDLYCHATIPDTPVLFSNVIQARWSIFDDRIYFAACFEEVTYVHCAAQVWVPGNIHIMWSSQSIPLRTLISSAGAGALAMELGLSAVVGFVDGAENYACADWNNGCFDVTTSPTNDPLFAWPPLGDGNLVQGYFEDPLPPLAYQEANLTAPPNPRMVVLIDFVRKGAFLDHAQEDLLRDGVISFITITNIDGEPVRLQDGPTSAPQGSISRYLPSVRYKDLNLIADVISLCTYEYFNRQIALVNEQVALVVEEEQLAQVALYKYKIDAFNAGLAHSSCQNAATRSFNSDLGNITKGPDRVCTIDPEVDPVGFENDACCTLDLVPIACCRPAVVVEETEFYSSVDYDSVYAECGSPACAATFYEDLYAAFNAIDDPVKGCYSNLGQDVQSALLTAVELELDRSVRYCRDLVGFGNDYQGRTCLQHSDCATLSPGTCRPSGVCDLPPLHEVENAFLDCYIDRMTPQLENYVRLYVLPSGLDRADRTSAAFRAALKEAATEMDCVNPNDAVDVEMRTRYEWDGDSADCKATILGLELPQDAEELEHRCPALPCLGTACRVETQPCYSQCRGKYYFKNATKERCEANLQCNVAGISLSECNGGFECAYCPNPNWQDDCVIVPGISSQSECDNVVACEIPGGDVRFDLTAQECEEMFNVCSAKCKGQSCRSYKGLSGVCSANVASSDDCAAFGAENGIEASWVEGTTCLLPTIPSSSICSEIATKSVWTLWSTCGAYDVTLDLCVTNNFTPQQRYLQCYLDEYRDCKSKDECEATGSCSDFEWATIPISRNYSQGIVTQYGACILSGYYYFAIANNLPFCSNTYDVAPLGCRDRAVTSEEDCPPFAFEPNGEWMWRAWLEPATTKGECMKKELPRYGCLPPGPELHMYFHNASECECKGWQPQHAYQWTDGVWQSGVARKAVWIQKRAVDLYTWNSALSFLLLEEWDRASVELVLLYTIKSNLLCQSNIITGNLATVVCDCVASDSPKDASCYSADEAIAVPVGVTVVCINDLNTFVKGPSSFAFFDPNSVSARCSEVNLATIKQSWFASPDVDTAVSFQFEKARPLGIVVNNDRATVGELVGDGSEITFSRPEYVGDFQLCLLVSADLSEDDIARYPVRDFGYTTDEYDTIVPIGISNIELGVDREVIGIKLDAEFWCAVVNHRMILSGDDVIRVFPVYRAENFQDKNGDIYSDRAKSLVYTLGALYLVDLVLLLIFICVLGYELHTSKKDAPVVAWIAIVFIILCIFRVVFCFLWAGEKLDDNEVAEYVMFEIPTFLLFTTVILCIGFWRKLSKKNSFFFNSTDQSLRILMLLGVSLVWIMFIVVAVVYSEVVLKNNNPESDCPGRVPADNSDLKDATRTLSVAYQSILIFFTFILGTMFFYSSYTLFKITSRGVTDAKRFIFRLGVLIVSSFMLRCIFFIILLAADFTSDIYLFIVLLLTEVIMIFLVQLEFNKRFLTRLILGGSALLPSGMRLSSNTATNSSNTGSASNSQRNASMLDD